MHESVFRNFLPHSNGYPFNVKYIHIQFIDYCFNLLITSIIIIMEFLYCTL